MRILPGYAYQEGRDAGMSPLLYSGNNFSALLGFEKRANKSIHRADVSGIVGFMQVPGFPQSFHLPVKAYRLQFDYKYLHQVKAWKTDALRLYAGGVWNTLANLRYNMNYDNNAYNYDFSTSLGGAVALFYNFKIRKKPFLFYSEIELPLVAFNIRPAYASSIPEGFFCTRGE